MVAPRPAFYPRFGIELEAVQLHAELVRSDPIVGAHVLTLTVFEYIKVRIDCFPCKLDLSKNRRLESAPYRNVNERCPVLRCKPPGGR